MNSKTFLFVFTIAAFAFAVQSARAEVDMTDPNIEKDNARLKMEQVTQGQLLSRGVDCPTGTCFKDAVPDVGFDTTPAIEPVGEAAHTSDGKTKPVKTRK